MEIQKELLCKAIENSNGIAMNVKKNLENLTKKEFSYSDVCQAIFKNHETKEKFEKEHELMRERMYKIALEASKKRKVGRGKRCRKK